MDRQYFVYILTNKNNTVLYTGVTNSLQRRLHEHRNSKGSSFTAKYRCTKLVYFEEAIDSLSAIQREKQIKAGSRAKKLQLVDSQNPKWEDLGKQYDLF